MIVTRVGKVCYGEHRFRGFGALADLLGVESTMGLNALGVGGRRISRSDAEVLDMLCVAHAAADPRIWPLKLTRLLAAYGSPLLAFAGAQLCTEGDTIGGWVAGASAEILTRAARAIEAHDERAQDDALVEIARRPRLPGWGLAFRPEDERLVALRPKLVALGVTERPYWKLWERLSALILRERNLVPNTASASAAVLLDMGFTPPECAMMLHLCVMPNHAFNAVEGAAQAPAILRRLPAERVEYVGPPPRQSSRTDRARRAL